MHTPVHAMLHVVGVNVSVIMCILVWIHVHVCVALPIVVGAWPMAGTLWRHFINIILMHTPVLSCVAIGIGEVSL